MIKYPHIWDDWLNHDGFKLTFSQVTHPWHPMASGVAPWPSACGTNKSRTGGACSMWRAPFFMAVTVV